MMHRLTRMIDNWLDQPPWSPEFAAVFWLAVCVLFWVYAIKAVLWALSA